jgi:hypothetical protein
MAAVRLAVDMSQRQGIVHSRQGLAPIATGEEAALRHRTSIRHASVDGLSGGIWPQETLRSPWSGQSGSYLPHQSFAGPAPCLRLHQTIRWNFLFLIKKHGTR